MSTIEQVIREKIKKHNIDIINPVTIQDKINWLKFHDSTPLKGECADKIRIHDYCKRVLGEDLCVPIIKTYDSINEIKLDELPNRFVMKANHGYNMNIVCKDKSRFNFNIEKRKLDKWLNTDFGHESGQPHYSYIKPKILVEQFLDDENQKDSLFDYKFWCFNGKAKLWTINDGHGHGDIVYYDMEDNCMDLYETGSNGKYKKPDGFSKMVEYAEKLAKPFKFVRVDFYEVNGRIYLGELTFTPGNGLFIYKKKGAAEEVGALLDLCANKKYEDGVSICLTAYKVQDYIEETLDSIAKQTWFKTHNNWEMILGIDGCEDTLGKVKSIMHKYKNLRVLYMDSNCGTYVTTNTVASQAKYDGLIRFDCDDIMNPDMVETIMKEKGDGDMVYFQYVNFGRKGGTSKTCGQIWVRHSIFDEFGGYIPWTCSGDAEFEVRVSKFAKKKFIKKVLMKRRLHGQNLTMRKDTCYHSILRGDNMDYLFNVKNSKIDKKDAIVVTFTNTFTEIENKDTNVPNRNYPFPRLDVIYQNKNEWKLKKEPPAVSQATAVTKYRVSKTIEPKKKISEDELTQFFKQ